MPIKLNVKPAENPWPIASTIFHPLRRRRGTWPLALGTPRQALAGAGWPL